jgi:signal transduction histidine kinase/CheY-like chemotaxis protein
MAELGLLGLLLAALVALSGGLQHPAGTFPAALPWLWFSSGLMLAVLRRTRAWPVGLVLLAGGVLGLTTWPDGMPAEPLRRAALIPWHLLVLATTARLGTAHGTITETGRTGLKPTLHFSVLVLLAAGVLAAGDVWLLAPGLVLATPTGLRTLLADATAHAGAMLILAPGSGLLLAPLRGKALSRPQALAVQAFWVQCAGLGLTLLATGVTADMQQRARAVDLDGQTRTLATTLQNHFDMAQRDIERLRDLHYRAELDLDEMDAAGSEILHGSPWIRLFAVLPRVTAQARTAFEDSPTGLDRQSIREIGADGAVLRAGARAVYYPVRTTVPISGLEALIGIDEAADPVRGAAIHAAVAEGRTVTSQSFSSLSRTASEACVTAVYTPVLDMAWRQDEAHDPHRVRALIGAVVDLGWMLQHALARSGFSEIDLLLHEPASREAIGVWLDDTRLVRPWPPGQDNLPARMQDGPHARHPVQFGGREWVLLGRPAWARQWPQPDMTLATVLGTGLLFTALLSAMLRARQRHLAALQAAHDDLERQVARRTAALADSNRQLSAEIDERRRLEDDLRQASRQAEQASQAKTLFLANMSHEIRTPLNAVLGYTQILLEDRALPGAVHARLRTILQAGQRLLRLINDVLDLSKIEAGGLQLHRAPFDLRQEFDEIARLFDERTRARGLRWQATIDLADPEPVHGDRTKIGQIVMNLLGNAVKFTEHGSVTLAVRRRDHRVEVEVGDTGPGIDAGELAQLFAPFRQGRAGLDKGGTGLGLVLARHLVAAMGGDLTIDSTPGRGTTARLVLPLPVEDDARLDVPTPDAAEPVECLDPATPVRAVVVEDDLHSRDILVHLLRRIGCPVEAAADGQAGLDLIRRWRPDIVFTDIRMPVLDGLHMLSRLRADDGPALPVVAVSASSLEHERRHYIEQGFSDFVGKPYAFQDIYRMLVRHAGARFVPCDTMTATPAIAQPAPPAGIPARAPDDATLATLAALREAAADGQMRRVRAQLDALDQAARLSVADRQALHRAARDYDLDDLVRQIDALSEHDATLPSAP